MLNALQRRLELLHEVEVGCNVEDFLIQDQESGFRERLLVAESDDELRLALHIDAGVMATYAHEHNAAPLLDRDLDALCVVVEGVSHFVYLAWRGRHGRHVSLLELELQAEIDKYLILVCSAVDERMDPSGLDLLRRLFIRVDYDPRLTPHAQQRYALANRYALRYCTALHCLYTARANYAGLLRASRRFYRYGESSKLAHIGSE